VVCEFRKLCEQNGCFSSKSGHKADSAGYSESVEQVKELAAGKKEVEKELKK
jgi:hypothetical protein